MIEFLAFSGLDYVRIDLTGGTMNPETVRNLIRTAHAAGITPFVRVERLDPVQIQTVLGMGALGVVVPEVTGRADVEAAVRAAKMAPLGERGIGLTGLDGYGLVTAMEYARWAAEHVILAVQVETRGAVEEADAIMATPGLDMVLGGRGTLSKHYGVPGQRDHPTVVAIEDTVMEKAFRAGKIVSVTYFPLRDPRQAEAVKAWIRRGAHCLCIGADMDMVYIYRRALQELRE
jgi:4-hydroxy-2-oxoheptanedioate aldolase